MFNVTEITQGQTVTGYQIELSRGDTGAIRISAEATLNGSAFTFGSDDRALFSIKNGQGEIVKEQAYEMDNNEFIVYFQNADTDSYQPGNYQWDVRYIIHPYYDSAGRIIDGDQVITPKEPQTMNLINVVGDI